MSAQAATIPLVALPTALLAARRRERRCAALIDLASEVGLEQVTPAVLCARAGVPESVLLGEYGSVHDCPLATLEEIVARTQARVVCAYLALASSERERLLAAYDAWSREVRHRPTAMRLCLAAASSHSPQARERVRRGLELLTEGLSLAHRRLAVKQ